MFGKPTAQPPGSGRTDRREQSFLQRGVRLEGNVQADGDLRVEGTVNGTLEVEGVIIIGPEAVADGVLKGHEVLIHGKAQGLILADHRVHLAKGARVTAHLFCHSLVIDEGVFFHGRSHMGEAIPDVRKARELVRAELRGRDPRAVRVSDPRAALPPEAGPRDAGLKTSPGVKGGSVTPQSRIPAPSPLENAHHDPSAGSDRSPERRRGSGPGGEAPGRTGSTPTPRPKDSLAPAPPPPRPPRQEPGASAMEGDPEIRATQDKKAN